ncbi:MAG TPA: hypothetical protein VIL25_06165 [Vicinamibacterales bacterium]
MPRALAFLVLLGVLWPLPAAAQQRPLVTEDPLTIGEGRLLIELGVETGANITYPVSGLTGDRLSIPFGVSFGLGEVAELQIDGGYNWLDIERRRDAPLSGRVGPGDRTGDVHDVVVATKVTLLREGERRPAFGLRLATQLPNASNESGLGLDSMTFIGTLLAGKTTGSTRIVANAGIAIMSDVIEGSIQQDAFVGSLSVARALNTVVEVVGEIAMQRVFFADEPPVGAEPRGALRGGIRFTRGGWRADAGLVLGLTRQDPDYGFMAGLTWVGQVR